MALERWLFLYTAPGLPSGGRVDVVRTDTSTTTLAGFPTTDAAMVACRAGLQAVLSAAQLVELCGGFDSRHVLAVREMTGATVPVGLVTFTGDMTDALYRLFAS